MNKNINEQTPAWFFTNERLGPTLAWLKQAAASRWRVVSIGGGGDFAFSLLSLFGSSIESIDTYDIRPLAKVSFEFKREVFRHFDYADIRDYFLAPGGYFNLGKQKNLTEGMSEFSQSVVGPLIEYGNQKDSLIKILNSRGYWYRDSLWQMRSAREYLLYLESEQRYQHLVACLDSIHQHEGELFQVIRTLEESSTDVIYLSNLFDNKVSMKNAEMHLASIRLKLSSGGFLVCCTMSNGHRLTKAAISAGLRVAYTEKHFFSLLSALKGHYDYSYFVFSN